MTIYRLYTDNGSRAGFWVQHRSWQNICARITSVAGRAEGQLPGRPPLHERSAVRVAWFDIRSGRPVDAPDAAETDDALTDPTDIHFSYIAEPVWARRPSFLAAGARRSSPVASGRGLR